MSIHQPRYSIFSLFDRLILLNKGEIVYRGLCQRSVEYFAGIGMMCEFVLVHLELMVIMSANVIYQCYSYSKHCCNVLQYIVTAVSKLLQVTTDLHSYDWF